ncbi:MAG: acyl-CoA dehydratase activase-related protein [Planctomycetaceae bacterium]|jgi:predicted CoA-substrate-specific enzyme activase|nr:acyl-CoA dehydratase activase-related protein [Planctomycetaceae bacterium]
MLSIKPVSEEITQFRLGLDIGSTTVKAVVFDAATHEIVWSSYARHFSGVFQALAKLVSDVFQVFPDKVFTLAMTGSAGIGVSQKLGVPFVQEVVAALHAITTFIPQTSVAIELGGEDAKVTFLEGSIDQRMNETCAGGTGAFIDQIAVTLKTDAAGINDLASRHKTIYPIAARCGVFTKSDVTMLLNEGASREDVAASVLQAVVDQTIGGLACGRKICGPAAFLGGPLHFLPELRKRFTETLGLDENSIIAPDNSHYYVALGAAILSENDTVISAADLCGRVNDALGNNGYEETVRLAPLFASKGDFDKFTARHDSIKAERADIATVTGDLFLGIDAGSTTTKAVLTDADSRILVTWYGSNDGDPINAVLKIISEIYSQIPTNMRIRRGCVTGYGETILKAALGIDDGEVETLAHFRAAKYFVPDVSFILDIGGQDIKCIGIKNGKVDKIVLNEACSSGCGSFLETFAGSLGYDIVSFSREALFAASPIDLGTRCTVFMNSKVKQAQKENASVADISAGLAYSVAKNALYKVLKITDFNELGKSVMVQGGTFNNPAVLRALEFLIDREVYRTDIAGMMGAFGASLIARERAANKPEKLVSGIISRDDLANFKMESKLKRCPGCPNKCLLAVHSFPDNRVFVSGNKCERGPSKFAIDPAPKSSAQADSYNVAQRKTITVTENSPSITDSVVWSDNPKRVQLPNFFRYQYDRLFNFYEPLDLHKAIRGEIGVPRVLNMFEVYPFWFSFLTGLGFRVVLSEPSTPKLYNKGLSSIPSQTLCFPAKLAHGHIINLVERGVKRIFYPALPFEQREFSDALFTHNCPVVGSYPELLRLNIDELRRDNDVNPNRLKIIETERAIAVSRCGSPKTKSFVDVVGGVDFISPFLPAPDAKIFPKRLYEEFRKFNVSYREIKHALAKAVEAQNEYRNEVRNKGKEFVESHSANGTVVVLVGRPYHLDPMIHHGIPELVVSSGAAVLSGDSVAHLGKNLMFPLRVVDQWSYHARLYRAATFVANQPNFQLIQLNSFGCGLDAVTAEQVEEILAFKGKVHTLLKIDEGTQLGAVKIRVRSLLATL